MMQHCFCNLCYICNWNFVASAKDIWDIERERIRCWINERVTYIILHISTKYHALHSIMEPKKKNILLKYKIQCLNILYIQIKIYLLFILHISLQIQYNLNLKIRERGNNCCHISSVHKTYLHIGNSHVLQVQLLTNLSCVCSCCYIVLCGTFLQTERCVKRKC